MDPTRATERETLGVDTVTHVSTRPPDDSYVLLSMRNTGLAYTSAH